MKTSEFRTRTMYKERQNLKVDGYWGSAIDIGYSAVKGFSPNSISCFPSYAKLGDGDSVKLSENEQDNNLILYRNNITGEKWVVGAQAQNLVSISESVNSAETLYARNRYINPLFKVIAETGIGINMLSNSIGSIGNDSLMIQTGLPPAYFKPDAMALKEALAGEHSYSIKLGNREWQQFNYNLPISNIRVIQQPVGTLKSICYDKNGNLVPEAKKYQKSKVLIIDPGFKTLDTVYLMDGEVKDCQTHESLGMFRILSDVSKKITEECNIEIPVHAIQSYLESGFVPKFNAAKFSTEPFYFDDIIEKCSNDVCMEAMTMLRSAYNNFLQVDYIVLTGGTGAAWSNLIRDYLKNMKTISVLSGNQNDDIPYQLSNVRGYYMHLYEKLRALTV